MIENHVYLRFKPEFADAGGRAEAAAKCKVLSEIPQVRKLRVCIPADSHAQAAWDMALVVEFDSLEDFATYAEHPVHERFVSGFLKARIAVVKHWNFEVQ